MDHRAVLYRMEACGREHRRSLETACTRTAGANPDVYALSRNTPKGVETLLANCLAHGRRQVVEVVDNFRSEEHTSELQSQSNLVCRLLLEKKKKTDVESGYERSALTAHDRYAVLIVRRLRLTM